ncbi:hypothetical protein SAMN06265218_10679 [Fodinibius sediminis]|uniref:Uncharacterized protein n=1 Tax=Fodinibius sediminis TaxID=1214077 RepID=A0A521CIY0_9BACT|nr:hypothetical protein SAMN06265218_10679 [Fodinibius sediminis]
MFPDSSPSPWLLLIERDKFHLEKVVSLRSPPLRPNEKSGIFFGEDGTEDQK